MTNVQLTEQRLGGAAHVLEAQSVAESTKRYLSPLRLLALATVTIFAAEFFIMFGLSFFPRLSLRLEAILDAFVLTALTFPALYFLFLRPLTLHSIERSRLEAQLRQAQKMEAVGQLTSGIAHDFNNILSVVLATAQLGAQYVAPEQEHLRDSLRDVESAAERGAAMIKKLLGFSRTADLVLVPTDLGKVVSNLSGILSRVIPESIEVTVQSAQGVGVVRADPGAVEQILFNLATNARDAMPQGGKLQIVVRQVSVDDKYRASRPWAEPGEYVCLAVRDNGIGMDEKIKARIFDPFFTTKPPGVGTGLGMAMIYGLVKQHGGFVDVESQVGRGTTVTVCFPIVAEEAVALVPRDRPSEIRGGSETILLVEDEEALRRTATRVLKKFGYTVLAACDGEEGLAVYRTNKRDIDLVLSDLVMPRLSGQQLYEIVRREDASVKFILCTGYTALDLQEHTALDPMPPVLRKPWTLTEIARQVREVLDEELRT